MTELSLILGLDLLMVLLVGALVRWVFAHDNEPNEAQRLVVAIKGALSALRARQGRRSALAVAALTLTSAAIAQVTGDAPYRVALIAVGVLVGAGLTTLLSQLTLSLGVRTATATAAALRQSSSSAVLTLALRGGALIGLAVEACVSMVAAVLTLGVMLTQNGPTAEMLKSAQMAFSGLALGSVGAAVVSHLSGSAVAGAGAFGLHQLNEGTQTRFQLEPRNPAMVVSAVGPHLGPALTRAQDIVSLSVLSHITATVATLIALEDLQGLAIVPLLALPILVRSCGLLASAFALLSMRAEDSEESVNLLFRGQLAACVLSAAGMAGTCAWLTGDRVWLAAVSMGLLGLLGQLLLTLTARLYSERRSRLLRTVREAANTSSESAGTLGLATAGILTALGIVALAVLLAVPCALGGPAALPGGRGVALAMTVAGFLSTLTFSVALANLEPIVESACSLASLSAEGLRPQAQARLSSLDFIAATSGSLAQAHLTGGSLLVAGALAAAIVDSAAVGSASNLAVALVSTFAGCAFVLLTASLALRQTAHTIATANRETQRQLRGLARDSRGAISLPKDFSPSYRDQLDVVSDGAVRQLLLPVLSCLCLPLGLGALTLQWLGADQLRVAVVCFLVVGGVTAFAAAGVCGAANGLIASARRHSRAASTTQQTFLNRADLFAHALGVSIAPAARLAIAGATAAGLVLVLLGT